MAMYGGPVAYPMPSMMMQPAPMMNAMPHMGMMAQPFMMPNPFFFASDEPETNAEETNAEEPKAEEPTAEPTPEPKKRGVVKPPAKKSAGCSVCGDASCAVTSEVEHESRDGIEVMRMTLHRGDTSVEWGLELQKETARSLTVNALNETARKRRWDGDVRHKIGDVIVGVMKENGDWDRTREGMVTILARERAVKCEFTRATEFVATLRKGFAFEKLYIDIEKLPDGHSLLIQNISSVVSCATKYNEQHYERPLVPGDTIVAVNDETEAHAMIEELKSKLQIALSIRR